MTAALVAIPLRQQAFLLHELRNAKATLDSGALLLSESTGLSARTLRDTALATLSVHIRTKYTSARDALAWLAKRDRRIAVWCACAVAREALKYVKEGEVRPLRAIEVTEAWCRGEATEKEVKVAADAAAADAADAAAAAAYAAAADAADADAADAAYAAADDKWRRVHASELLRLVGVIADAVIHLPEQ